MKYILKPIFEMLTGDYILFNDIIYNYISMAIVGIIAFFIAWRIVGRLYHEHIINGSEIGSLIHWIIRIIVFIIVFYVFSVVIWLTKFIIQFRIQILILIFVIILIFIIIKTLKYIRR